MTPARAPIAATRAVEITVANLRRKPRAFVPLLQLCGLLCLLWIVFFTLDKAFPYMRSGADTIYRAKVKMLRGGLDADLVIFGNSKVLSGFVPAQFDRVLQTHSYNLGLPDEQRFIANLEELAASGSPPRIVVLTITQVAIDQPTGLFRYLNNDRAIVDRLFPFRHLPRDMTLFLLRSRTRGGPAMFYRTSGQIIGNVQRDRGYYFIEGQSHYPGNRIPSDFHLPSDRPDFVNARATLNSSNLTRLRATADRYSMQIWFVPSYFRPGEYAPPPSQNHELADMVRASPRFHLAGPDYWLLPLECFADGAHLNPDGAKEYTKRLITLLSAAMTH
jgi:hypothetical protein